MARLVGATLSAVRIVLNGNDNGNGNGMVMATIMVMAGNGDGDGDGNDNGNGKVLKWSYKGRRHRYRRMPDFGRGDVSSSL